MAETGCLHPGQLACPPNRGNGFVGDEGWPAWFGKAGGGIALLDLLDVHIGRSFGIDGAHSGIEFGGVLTPFPVKLERFDSTVGAH